MNPIVFQEYRRRFRKLLTPVFIQGIQSVYHDARVMSNSTDIIAILRQFQLLLKTHIPRWPETILEGEYRRIVAVLPYIEELYILVMTTFVMLMLGPYANLLTPNDIHDRLSFKQFIHRVYIDIARDVYYNPTWMNHIQPDMSKVEKSVHRAIGRELKASLTEEQLLNIYKILETKNVNHDDDDEDQADEHSDHESPTDEPTYNTPTYTTPLTRDIKPDDIQVNLTHGSQYPSIPVHAPPSEPKPEPEPEPVQSDSDDDDYADPPTPMAPVKSPTPVESAPPIPPTTALF